VWVRRVMRPLLDYSIFRFATCTAPITDAERSGDVNQVRTSDVAELNLIKPEDVALVVTSIIFRSYSGGAT
jgi:hypothetical protein